MNDERFQAARDAVDASDNAEQLRAIAAMLKAQHLTQAAHLQPAQQAAPHPRFNALRWLVIGGTVTAVTLAFALASVAIAIAAVCATACLLILRSLFNDLTGGRR